MIYLFKKDLELMMLPIVNKCLETHGGGESYFDNLDGKIKNNDVLMSLFMLYAIYDSGISNVILSGAIGVKYKLLKEQNKIPEYIKISFVNGGLRKGKEIHGGYYNLENIKNQKMIFIDDSYYSGKTAKKVEEFINQNGGEIVRKYVFYDGCIEKHDDVVSLYRYYN